MAKAEIANGDNVDANGLAKTIVATGSRDRPDEADAGRLEMTAAHGYSPQKENYAKRLRRIEGQVRGIAKMIDEDKYCIDVLTQISAVNSALQSVALGLLDEHLGHCVTQAVAEGGDEADAKLAEASAAIAPVLLPAEGGSALAVTSGDLGLEHEGPVRRPPLRHHRITCPRPRCW